LFNIIHTHKLFKLIKTTTINEVTMRILITGASGLVGLDLIEYIILNTNNQVNVLTRDKKKFGQKVKFPINIYEWDPERGVIDSRALEDVDCVVNLAGANIIDYKWDKAGKEKILKSRVKSTEILLKEIEKRKVPPVKFINASAIGFYGNTQEELLTENSPKGAGFLSDVCEEWENTLNANTNLNMRTYILRIGIVLSPKGGLIKKIFPIFSKGLGGNLGSGEQYLSWIHIDDLIGNIMFLLEKNTQHKVYNATSPRPVSNYIFTTILAKIMKRPGICHVPSFIIKKILGEKSEMILGGQKVIPRNFIDEGYQYKYKILKEALRDIGKYKLAGESIFENYIWVKTTKGEVFNYLSSEKNLEALTPEYLNFRVIGKSTKNIEEGTLINYKLKLHRVPIKWKSLITKFKFKSHFIDEQLAGPYKRWVHLHEFKDINGGTLIRDKVIYKLPFGKLGKLVAGQFIRKDLNKIFKYRNEVIIKTLN
jgi:uncharacterized protein (TIGR01777 family)